MKRDFEFSRPLLTGLELDYVREAYATGRFSGDGKFTQLCHTWLEQRLKCSKAFLTPSCTAALEMAALLADIEPGDEIIMPSFTFTSTANAFVLRGGVPVFVDIRPDTLNLNEHLIAAAISPRTKAICVMHYGGIACEMDAIMALAEREGLLVIEDAAHAIAASYKGRPLGSIGHLAALSFHQTKNVIAGEGGAILINAARFADRAEIIRDKGTNRHMLLTGEVERYTWVDIGSSFLPSELTAAFLWAQLSQAETIMQRRRDAWQKYHEGLARLEAQGHVKRPTVPAGCEHNAHLYYLLLKKPAARANFIASMREKGIATPFHYVPLHSSPAGKRFGRTAGPLATTDAVAASLVRLPLSPETGEYSQEIIDAVASFFGSPE